MVGRLTLSLPEGKLLLEREIEELPLTLGRAQTCNLVIDHASISRLHAEILREASGILLIKDRDSANGLYYHGKRVKEIDLTHDTHFHIGQISAQYIPFAQEDKTMILPMTFDEKTTVMSRNDDDKDDRDDLLSAKTVVRSSHQGEAKTSSIKLPTTPKRNTSTPGRKSIPLPPLSGRRPLKKFSSIGEQTGSGITKTNSKIARRKKQSWSFEWPKIDLEKWQARAQRAFVPGVILFIILGISYYFFNRDESDPHDTSYAWYKLPPRLARTPTPKSHPVQAVLDDLDELSQQ